MQLRYHHGEGEEAGEHVRSALAGAMHLFLAEEE